MTDKVQKIREEVERLRSLHQMKYQQLDTDNSMSLVECGKRNLCNELLSFIDSLQEEPVSNPIDFEKELYKAFGQVKDFTLGMRIAKWFYDIGKKSREPVSDDLEKEIQRYFEGWKNDPEYNEAVKPDFYATSVEDCKNIARHFANWQKEKMEAYRIKHCNDITNEQAEMESVFISNHISKNNRIPTFLDAIEYGMELKKEQMIADATEVSVHIEAGNYPYIPQLELYDYDKDVPLAKEGDKYKIVLIKEE